MLSLGSQSCESLFIPITTSANLSWFVHYLEPNASEVVYADRLIALIFFFFNLVIMLKDGCYLPHYTEEGVSPGGLR